jgi:NADH dehydrogenase (ubiquinone) 1 alpha/beta subcomplex 1
MLSSAIALRGVVLRHLRASVTASSFQPSALPTLSNIISRGFGGGFLDKDAVTERVLHVTKHFEKIDAAKVGQRSRRSCSGEDGAQRSSVVC